MVEALATPFKPAPFFTFILFSCLFIIMLCYNTAESESTISFLNQLATWDKEEMNAKLQQRVGFSKRAIGKLLQAFDGVLQRYENLTALLSDKASKDLEDASTACEYISCCCSKLLEDRLYFRSKFIVS